LLWQVEGYHREVSESVSAEPTPVDWLTAEELESWLAVVRLMTWLPWSIDQQLRRDSNLAMVEYQVLAMLSNSPQRTRRMSLLAEWANVSMSHLSRIVNRLEHRGLVRREPDPTDGRFTNAILTRRGHAKLVASAPAHVDTVRSLVIDPFSAAEDLHFPVTLSDFIKFYEDARK